MKWGVANEITVDVTPDRITIRDTDTAPLELAPLVYVDAASQHLKVMAVGELTAAANTAGHSPMLRVELFGSDPAPMGLSKLACLGAFFRFALKVVVDRHLFRVRPEVRVRGSETVSRALGGYERDLLKHALEYAGAKRVVWPETPL